MTITNVITPYQYLKLIGEQLAAVQAPGYVDTPAMRAEKREHAIATVKELLMQTNFTVGD